MSRYAAMFERLANDKQGAFIPFCVLGDPTPENSLVWLRALANAGADALELGIPFSDPVADGPTIQAADVRALNAGTTPAASFGILKAFRSEFPNVPVGLLVYANLVVARGRDHFYASAADAGVDSVLIADVPTVEATPFVESATRHGVDPVFIATPTATDAELATVAQLTHGYTYVVTRRGVTGSEQAAGADHRALLQALARHGAPPAILGFGISTPEHVREAIASGAAGAISGSAVVAHIERNLGDEAATVAALSAFTEQMKAATGHG